MYVYPPLPDTSDLTYGALPVDFLLETVLKAGIEWFKTTPDSEKKVFGWLSSPYLNTKYGNTKALEIKSFIVKYDIKVVQSFTLIDQTVPTISLQLLDGSEREDRAGLADFQQTVDRIVAGELVGRDDVGYAAISDNVHIGIHVQNTPDLAKYLYYLVVYILNTMKPSLEARGLMLGTFRATDVSRLNEYLPENLYSRFINFTIFSLASFDRGAVPIIENIIGVHASPSGEGAVSIEGDPSDPVQFGMTFVTIGDSNE